MRNISILANPIRHIPISRISTGVRFVMGNPLIPAPIKAMLDTCIDAIDRWILKSFFLLYISEYEKLLRFIVFQEWWKCYKKAERRISSTWNGRHFRYGKVCKTSSVVMNFIWRRKKNCFIFTKVSWYSDPMFDIKRSTAIILKDVINDGKDPRSAVAHRIKSNLNLWSMWNHVFKVIKKHSSSLVAKELKNWLK